VNNLSQLRKQQANAIRQPLPDEVSLPNRVTQYEDLCILRIKQVGKLLGLSRSAIYNRLDPKNSVYDPTFPQRIELGGGSIGFRAGEVFQWIAKRPPKK